MSSNQASPSSDQAPPPFREIGKNFREGLISWDEYIHQLFLHCLPQYHESLEFMDEYQLRAEDDFGYIVYGWHDSFTDPGTDIEALEAVIRAYKKTGTVRNVKAKLGKLPAFASNHLQSVIGLLALQDRNLPVLRMLLIDNGQINFDQRRGHAFMDLANGISLKKERELWEMIEDSRWRGCHPWRRPGERDIRGD